MRGFLVIALIFAHLSLINTSLRAQETPPSQPAAVVAPPSTPSQPAAISQPVALAAGDQLAAPSAPTIKDQAPSGAIFSDEKYGSLVFTFWEHQAIKEAKNARGLVRAPSEQELMQDLKKDEDLSVRTKPPPEEREIRLGGIVFRGTKDWTIWLNEKRITPEALPEEVIDLKVYKNYVEMKWFDEWSNQIFPIRLRPHQRFNIDARMFLPG